MSDTTFDASKNYKKICYRADRDLLNTELNEAQDIEHNERTALFDKVFSPGTIISGLDGTVSGSSVTLTNGVIYLEGCVVRVPGATLTFPTSGTHIIYVDVFRREVTVSDDDSLVNPLTGEPTAEREKWIATLQNRDTSGDTLPDGATSRTVVPIYTFNVDTGVLQAYVSESGNTGGGISSMLADHIGHGGLDRHSAVNSTQAGFMTPAQLADLESKAENSDLTALSNALTTHKSSSDHDSRYYTETESNANFAPKSHVGSGGTAHSAASASSAGFMAAADKTRLSDHETRIVAMETALPEKATEVEIQVISTAFALHRTSNDHDSNYYPKDASDARFAPIAHVGATGDAHGLASASANGFISKEACGFLKNLIKWEGKYNYNNASTTSEYSVISLGNGMIWHGKCDGTSSQHRLATHLRATSTQITALFEFFHMTGTITMSTGDRVALGDSSIYVPRVPGGQVYTVEIYPDSYTSVTILVTGSGDIGFTLSIFPGDERQICSTFDPAAEGMSTHN
ncbi:MAG: DUF4815 domain-containing protein [Armatimonadota bacterium]|nr:DUF4815 domain-containing protein [bacterium]